MSACKHPTCGSTCRREKKAKKVYALKRTPLKRSTTPITRKPIKKKRQAPIKKAGKKRASIDRRLYLPAAKKFREDNPHCRILAPGCTCWTQGVHHPEGKATIELLLDASKWIPACNHCNRYVETHHAWAEARGFKRANNESKLSKFKADGSGDHTGAAAQSN